MPAGTTAKLIDHSLVGVNVAAATGVTDAIDLGDACQKGAAFSSELTAISGGTTPGVTVKVQHSPDGSTWFDLEATWAAMTAADQDSSLKAGPIFRYVRYHWTTTGTPTIATANFRTQAATA